MIKGIEKLTEEQKDLMEKTNNLHTEVVGLDYKKRNGNNRNLDR